MSQGHIAELPRRGVVAISGPDREKFLDGIVTNDLTAIPVGDSGYGGLLTPQGKILFDFIVYNDRDQFLFDLPAVAVADFVKRLGFYKLRAMVDIEGLSAKYGVAAAWGVDAPPAVDGLVVVDPRLKALGFRLIVAARRPIAADGYALADEHAYDAHRIALGVPEGEVDFAYGEAFPHDVDMDQLAGISFDKGCYVGQEVVSRMEHRGTARRRIVQVLSASPMPPTGAEIVADGRPVGSITSSSEHVGLALVRLDRVNDATDAAVPLLVRGMPIEIAIPDWAHFRHAATNARE
jgi:folate-binding protein YgfZ